MPSPMPRQKSAPTRSPPPSHSSASSTIATGSSSWRTFRVLSRAQQRARVLATASWVISSVAAFYCTWSMQRGTILSDRKSTRLTPVTNAHLVCRLLLEKKKNHNDTYKIIDLLLQQINKTREQFTLH